MSFACLAEVIGALHKKPFARAMARSANGLALFNLVRSPVDFPTFGKLISGAISKRLSQAIILLSRGS
jgi:hypothetical protein